MFRRLLGKEKTPRQEGDAKLRGLGGTALQEQRPKIYKNFEEALREVGWEGISELLTKLAAKAVATGTGSEERWRFPQLWWGVPEGTTVKISPAGGLERLDGQLRVASRGKDSIKREISEEGYEVKLTHKQKKTGGDWAEVEPCFGFRPYRHSAFRDPWGSFEELAFPYMAFTSWSRVYTEQLVELRVNEQGEPLFQLQFSPPEALDNE